MSNDQSKLDKIDLVMGRAMRDEKFRKQLVDAPQATLAAEGISEADLNNVTGGAGALTSAGLQTLFTNESLLSNLNRAAYCTDTPCGKDGAVAINTNVLNTTNRR